MKRRSLGRVGGSGSIGGSGPICGRSNGSVGGSGGRGSGSRRSDSRRRDRRSDSRRRDRRSDRRSSRRSSDGLERHSRGDSGGGGGGTCASGHKSVGPRIDVLLHESLGSVFEKEPGQEGAQRNEGESQNRQLGLGRHVDLAEWSVLDRFRVLILEVLTAMVVVVLLVLLL